MDKRKKENLPPDDSQKVVQMPMREDSPMGNGMPMEQDAANFETTPSAQPSELEIRAQNEMAMLQRTAQKKKMQAQMKPKIDAQAVIRASEILRKYKEGKARLEQKIIANEEFWKLRQWNYMNDGNNDFKPATAWLWSCIQSRYSDAMDSYPTCNFQPRQMDDKAEAIKLSNIVPVILEQNRYEDVYSDVAWYALKHGGCVQGIFWDGSKHNGIGDVTIKKIDAAKVDDDNYIIKVDSSVCGAGRYYVTLTAYIPDSDFIDGFRTEKRTMFTGVTIDPR